MSIEVNGKVIATDEEGFLLDLDDWDEQVLIALAKSEEISMTEEQQALVQSARDFFLEKQHTPSTRDLIKIVAEKTGVDRHSNRQEIDKQLYRLFPHGPDKQLAKLAGLPKPLPSDTEA